MTVLDISAIGNKWSQQTGSVLNTLGASSAITIRFKDLERVLFLGEVHYSVSPAATVSIQGLSIGTTPADFNVVGLTVQAAAGLTVTVTATALGI